MPDDDETTTRRDGEDLSPAETPASDAAGEAAPSVQAVAPAQLGVAKYVHAAYIGVGVLVALLSGQLLASAWNALAAWSPAVRVLPQLLVYGEDERPAFTAVAGAALGAFAVLQLFRRPDVGRWSDEVAAELAKVVWPARETVTNGTIVVIVATATATVYVGLLDRLWGFVTTLVYGA